MPINLKADVLTRQIQFDGAPTTGDRSFSVQAGTVTSGQFGIYNTGDTASGTFNVGFYISPDNTTATPSNDTLVTTRSLQSIAAGTVATDTFSLPAFNTPGLYYVYMLADPEGVVPESSDFDNDSFTWAINVTPTTLPKVSIVAANADHAEGSDGNPRNEFTFTVTRSGDLRAASSVDFAVTGTGASPAQVQGGPEADISDASPFNGRVTFAPGQMTQTITVFVNGDTRIESDETFKVELVNARDATIDTANGSAIGTIRDDDGGAVPTLGITTATYSDRAEGSGGGLTDFEFSVFRNGTSTSAASADWTVTGSGSNPAGTTDFDGMTGSVSFLDGETVKKIVVKVRADQTFEADETFTVTLSNPSAGATINPNATSAVGTIRNDDTAPGTPPTLRIFADQAQVTEGSSGGLTDYTFTVTRQGGDTSASSRVDWSLAFNTSNPADASDFLTTSGRVDFNAGQTQQTITLKVNADTAVELNETFRIVLNNPVNGTIDTLNDDAAGQITNDDTAPGAKPDLDASDLQLTKTTVAVGENFNWIVDVANIGNASAGGSETRLYRSTDAVWDVNDVLVASGAQNALAAGAQTTNATYGVALNQVGTYFLIARADGANAVDESNENNNPTNAVQVTVTGAAAPQVAIVAASADKPEGSGGGYTDYTFTVTRTGDTSVATSVTWQLGVTNGDTIENDDWNVASSGPVNWAAGETGSKTVTVKIVADTQVEGDETFVVRLTNPTNATIDGSKSEAIGTVRNDDGGVPDLDVTTLSVSRASLTAGGATTLTYNLKNVGTGAAAASTVGFYRSADNVFDSSDVLIGSQNVGALAAGATLNGSFSLTLPTAGNYALFAVADSGKIIAETSETNNPSNAVRVNVAALPVLSIAAASADKAEGSGSGLTPFTFTVTRTGSTTDASSATWTLATTSGDSVETDDYAAPASGTVNFAAGQTQQTITINVRADTVFEGNETFAVKLTGATGATLNASKSTANGTIRNDDAALPDLDVTTLSVSRASLTAGNATTLTYQLKNVGGDSAAASTVGFYRSADNVFDSSDVLIGSQNVGALAAGATLNGSFSLTLPTAGNYALFAVADSGKVIAEPSETNNPSNAVRVNVAALPVLSIAAASADKAEGSGGGLTPFTFTVTRTGSTTDASSATWQLYDVLGGDTIETDDYGAPTSGTVNFATGQTTQTITVNIRADTVFEGNETFAVQLESATGATINASKKFANGVVRNDDAAFPDLDVTTLSVSRASLTAGGATTLTYHLENDSPTAAGASTVGFYRSADNVFDASDVLIGSQNVGALAAGASIDRSFTLTLPTAGNFAIFAVADSGKVIAELSETNNPSNAVRVNVAPLPVLSIAAASADKAEGSGGGLTPFTFTVTRTGSTTDASSATWQLYYTTGDSIDGEDFAAPTDGTVNFAAGETTKTITINIKADTLFEPDEGLAVKLETATGATINASKDTAFGTVQNDDVVNSAAHDLNGDGKSDILWRNDNGQALLWQMNGETITTEAGLGTEPATKELVDAADFTGDGKADLLWHIDNGSAFIWEMNGSQVGIKSTLTGPGANWEIQDAADFGGDGKADILWRHDDGRLELWQMDGATPTAKTPLGSGPTGGTVADAADFNGDGTADILFQTANGNAAIWTMNGASVLARTNITGPGAGWTIQDAADFGGDGKADILWRHTDGRVELWQMDGTAVLSRKGLGDVDTTLTIQDVADFNGDKRADILWRNDAGEVTMWEMNGTQIVDLSDVRTMPSTWTIVNHDFA